jgi:hypothetical protein
MHSKSYCFQYAHNYQIIFRVLKVIMCCMLMATGELSRAEVQEEQDQLNTYIRMEVLPLTIGIGLVKEKYRGGIFASRFSSGSIAYSSIGVEYAFHFVHAKSDGLYGKVYAEHKQYDAGLKVDSRFIEESQSWQHAVLDNHKANHVGALLGYQWYLLSPSLYCQAGLGWQFNSNPVNSGPSKLGIGQSTKSQSGATAELGIGLILR